jgi:uncharacterized protein (DUF433 family)
MRDTPMPPRTESTRYPNIIHDPAIHDGAAVVAGTRLPVRTLAFYWRATHDRKRILRHYPQLTPELFAEAMHYYEAHQTEIDARAAWASDEPF